MIRLNELSLRRGIKSLLENVSLTLHDGQKVGLTGANGVGKSSLFGLFLGYLQPDAGSLDLPPHQVVAHVAQETPPDSRPAQEYVLDGDRELREVQQRMEATDPEHDGLAYAHLQSHFEAIGGYTAGARAARLLHGLGFTPGDELRSVSEFSGGWRMRLNLAQALMCRSDILLLDEPTNHLDIDAVIWLQDWLLAYTGTLVLISHDRDFLDEVCDHIIHIENRKATMITGNYSAFELRRAELLSQQQAARDKQQREIAHIQSYVERFRAQATKARQAQSRLKALARMELIAQAEADSPFDFHLLPPLKLPRPLLTFDQVSAGYGERRQLDGVSFTLSPGDRIGLLGANGAGKSTLIKAMAGVLDIQGGKRVAAQDLRIGYFAQHQIEQLSLDESPLWHVQRLNPVATEKELRNFLGGFDFQGDQALVSIAPFSGGEKARLALALLIYQRPNLLLLDEPTNHLDLEMRDALNRALQDFDGALVLVSHDRYLLRSVADQFWWVASHRLQPFDGDLDDYRRVLAEHRRAMQDDTATAKKPEPARRDQRKQDAGQRQQLRALQQVFDRAEREVDKLTQSRSDLETELADPALYLAENRARMQRIVQQKNELASQLQDAENRWLEAGEALDNARQAMQDA
jgi:ATP-binding cassette subfamily F protein 3